MPARLTSLLPFTVLLAAVGCGEATRFEPDERLLVDRQIVPEHRQQIADVLGQLFGEPDTPKLPAALAGALDLEQLELAAGPVESHTPGVTHGLYRRHCAKCHGVTGNGRGPTALYQEPYPRDFRRGTYKYKSTERGASPTDADLHAVLVHGIPGTAMPSFRLLKPEEHDALVAYVRFLEARGQVERVLVEFIADELDFDPATGEVAAGNEVTLGSTETKAVVNDALAAIVARWDEAGSRVVSSTPPSGIDSPERVAAGQKLFHDTKRAGCVKCHGQGGQAGVALADFDDWNKTRNDFLQATELMAASNETLRGQWAKAEGATSKQLGEQVAAADQRIAARRAAAAADLPPFTAKARVLVGGVLRGGSDPKRLFGAIHEGIAGSPMPGVGQALSDDEVWDLVAYVRSLVHQPAPVGSESVGSESTVVSANP